jgi:hypothetical protein
VSLLNRTSATAVLSKENDLEENTPNHPPRYDVLPLDDQHVFFAEATGNRRADALANLIENPQIGMLFLIPGYEEALRLDGRAIITEDRDLLDSAGAISGNPPLVGVEVEECFLQRQRYAPAYGIRWNGRISGIFHRLPRFSETIRAPKSGTAASDK